MDAIHHAATNTAEDFAGGISGMARAIGKNPTTLAHELNRTGTAKLGLVDAIKMVKRSGDWRILTAAGTECGGLFVPLPASVSIKGSTFADLSNVAKEFSDLVKEITADLADNVISANDMARIDREFSELVAAGQLMVANLRAMQEGAASERTLKAA